jgi:hypothetical protein
MSRVFDVMHEHRLGEIRVAHVLQQVFSLAREYGVMIEVHRRARAHHC